MTRFDFIKRPYLNYLKIVPNRRQLLVEGVFVVLLKYFLGYYCILDRIQKAVVGLCVGMV